MSFKAGYTVVDEDGAPYITYEGADLVQAVTAAKSDFRGDHILMNAFPSQIQDTVAEERVEEEEYQPNLSDRDISLLPLKAMRRLGLGMPGRNGLFSRKQVMSLSFAEAHKRMLPYFQQPVFEWTGMREREVKRLKKAGTPVPQEVIDSWHWRDTGGLVKAYHSASYMRRGFITANTKLEKGERIGDSVQKMIDAGMLNRYQQALLSKVKNAMVRGVQMLPHYLAREATEHRPFLDVFGVDRQSKKLFTMCSGSNAACRLSCLFGSGQNPLAEMQTGKKRAMTEGFLMDPVAWLRVLVEAIEWHVKQSETQNDVPYVRLNVLTDVPWELVFPDLFKMFRNVSFYDYTKVAGRKPPRNYDLTFSFNGSNEHLTKREMASGKRSAVVFVIPREDNPCIRYKPPCFHPGMVGQVPFKGQKIQLLPKEERGFWGQTVVNGDIHDIRPLDKKRAVVGLTFKPIEVDHPDRPGRKTVIYEPEGKAKKFVIKTWRDQNGILVAASVPSQLMQDARSIVGDADPVEVS